MYFHQFESDLLCHVCFIPTSGLAVLCSKLVDERCQVQSLVALFVLVVSEFSIVFFKTHGATSQDSLDRPSRKNYPPLPQIDPRSLYRQQPRPATKNYNFHHVLFFPLSSCPKKLTYCLISYLILCLVFQQIFQ